MNLPIFTQAAATPVDLSNPDNFSEKCQIHLWPSKRARYQPISGLGADIELLITALQVELFELLETKTAPGDVSSIPASELSTIYYCSSGRGQMAFGQLPPIDVNPHTLVIVPPNQQVRVSARALEEPCRNRLSNSIQPFMKRALSAGSSDQTRGASPNLQLFVGRFRAAYCDSIDLFAIVPKPIIEQFEASDQVEARLRSALFEMYAQEIGARAMASALFKQVLVTLFRRFHRSQDLWQERFSLIGDPQIARTFAKMVARPGAAHTIESLSTTAALGRSTFMTRFQKAVGCSPMLALRQLRMKQAFELFESGVFSVDQVACRVGYASRSSFVRAFRQSFGKEPTECRRQFSPSSRA